eukprot:1377551-Amphidinium_carterae.1
MLGVGRGEVPCATRGSARDREDCKDGRTRGQGGNERITAGAQQPGKKYNHQKTREHTHMYMQKT